MKYIVLKELKRLQSLNTKKNLIFFLQAYVSCALGIHSIGYVMICFGVVNAICSIVFGSIMKYIGRTPIIALGIVFHFLHSFQLTKFCFEKKNI